MKPLANRLLAASLLLPLAPLAAAPVDMSGPGSYSQNFDTLASSGTTNPWADDSTIAAWYSQRTGTGTTYAADAGTNTAGNLYSYGAASDPERALGTLGSGNAAAGSFAHGLQLQNSTTGSLAINSLAYTGEQWRKSGVTTAQVVTLWYKISAAPITALDPATDTGWTAVSSGDFSSPINTSTSAALNGNDAANRVAISISPGIEVPAGNYVMIRWKDIDHTGSDHGLAIDDVSLSWGESSTPALTLGVTPSTIIENAGAAAAQGTVSIPAALGADLVVDLASSDTSEATVPATVTITSGNTSANFAVDAVDDLFADGSQAVTLSASASGYISAQTALTVDNDTDAPIAVSIDPATFAENAGNGAATGTVTLAANTVADLTVNLSSNDTSEATVPASVTIPGGSNSTTFAVDAVDDTDQDGTRNVTIQASATGYSSGSTVIQVTDDGDVPPPPTLSPGAIAFTGFNADGNDDLAFVALVPVLETDSIYFTDNPWNGSDVGAGGAFSGTEGVIRWTAPAGGLAAGSVVTLNSLSTTGRSASTGTLTSVSGSFALGASGETVYAYQGSPLVPSGFLAVIATQTSDPTTGTGLGAQHIVQFASTIDIAAYTGSRSDQSSYDGYLTPLVDTTTNWVTQDGGGDQSIDETPPDLPFDTASFTLASGGNTFAEWIGDYPGVGAKTAFTDDADGDGSDNGVENYLGSDPSKAGAGVYQVSRSGADLLFRHTRNNTPADGVSGSYQWSSDLASWQVSGVADTAGTVVTFGAPVVVEDNAAPVPDVLEVTAAVSGTPAQRVFVRIMAELVVTP